MDRFQAIRVFSQVVESGSFSATADKLGLSAFIVGPEYLSAKVRLFVDFLIERFSQAQDWSAP